MPDADAQTLSAADSAAINNLLGAGVLGAAVPAGAGTTPTSLMPLSPATWNFQFSAADRTRARPRSDVLQANSQPGAAAPWQYTAGTSTIYALGTAPDGSIVSPSEQDLTQGVLTQYAPARLVLAPGMQPGVPQTTTLQVNVYNIGDLSTVTHRRVDPACSTRQIDTRRFGPRPTVAGSNRMRSAHAPGARRPRPCIR